MIIRQLNHVLFLGVSLLLSLFTSTANSQTNTNICNEYGPYPQGDWVYTAGDYPDPNPVTIDPTEIFVALGDSATAPTFTGSPSFSDGNRVETVEYDCDDDDTNQEDFSYSVGSYEYEEVGHDIAWSGPFTDAGSYGYNVNVTGSPSVSGAGDLSATVGQITVTAVEVTSIKFDADGDGTDETYSDGDEIPVCQNVGNLVFSAELNPATAVSSGFDSLTKLTWTGATSTSTSDTATLSKANLAVTDVVATVGTSSVKITVHILAGIAPNSMSSVQYFILPNSGLGTNFGLVTPEVVDLSALNITSYFDCNVRKWKFKVVSALGLINKSTSLQQLSEASLNAATSETIYCDMVSDLSKNHTIDAGQWWMLSAIDAHEDVHVNDWRANNDSYFAAFKSSIESFELDFDASDASTASEAVTKYLGSNDYAIDKSTYETTVVNVWNTTLQHGQGTVDNRTEAAANAVKNARILDLNIKAQQQGWSCE